MIIFYSILTFYELSTFFRGSWGSSVNSFEPKIEPPSANLACPNPWNALYEEIHCKMTSTLNRVSLYSWQEYQISDLVSLTGWTEVTSAGFVTPNDVTLDGWGGLNDLSSLDLSPKMLKNIKFKTFKTYTNYEKI